MKTKSLFFDIDNRITIVPDPRNISKYSLFGHDVKFSKYSKLFYVGSPRATKSISEPADVGAVYICPINNPQSCSERILPEITLNVATSIHFKALFGYSLIEYAQNIIIICGPNIAFTNVNFYCAQYNTITRKIKNDTLFPIKRLDEYGSYVFDNYGMQVESWTEEITRDTNFIYSQYTSIYSSILGRNKESQKSIIFGTVYTYMNYFPLRYIPGKKFLVNHNDEENFLIVPYPDPMFMIGAFDVFNYAYINRQSIDVSFGTPGQGFGYSGAIGAYNSDACDDVIFTAPFFSEKPDQGLLLIYYCNKETKRFNMTPQVLKGDNIAYARFGISVANIQDRNNDIIDDIAVLAPFWYVNNPTLYIYLSSSDGLTQNYFKKIELQNSKNFIDNFAFKLISNFDIDDDQINGIKLLVLHGFIRYKDIDGITNTISDFDVKVDQKLLMCQTTIIIYFGITNINEVDLTQKPHLKYKISLSGRENSYFNILGYPTITEGTLEIKSISEYVSIELNILYWYYPIPDKTHIQVLAEGSVEKSDICTKKCLTSNKMSLTEQIIPSILPCNELLCLPKLSLNYSIYDANFFQTQILDIGISNIRSIIIEITHTDIVKSLYPQLTITCPDYVKVVSYEIDKELDISIKKNEYTNKNNTLTFIFTWRYDFTNIDKVRFNLHLDMIPSFAESNLNIILAVKDALYRLQSEESQIIEFALGKDPVILTGLSTPNVINISKHEDSDFKEGTDKIMYKLQVFNSQKYYSIDDVYIYIRIPYFYENHKVFDFDDPAIDSQINKSECPGELFSDCDDSVFIYHNSTILPNSVINIKIFLKENNNTQQLAIKNVNKTELMFVVKHKRNGQIFTEMLLVNTLIKSKIVPHAKDLLIPIVIAVVLSLLVIGTLIFIIIKFKFAEKIKAKFSNDEIEKI